MDSILGVVFKKYLPEVSSQRLAVSVSLKGVH